MALPLRYISTRFFRPIRPMLPSSLASTNCPDTDNTRMTAPSDIVPAHANRQMAPSPNDELEALRVRVAELERESASLKWTNEAINVLASVTGSITGQEFLQTLVQQLSAILNVRYVFITRWAPGRAGRLRTVAGWCCGRASDALEYDLPDTPCQKVLEDGEAFFPHNIRQLFPRDEYLATHNIESYMGVCLLDGAGRPTGHLCIMDELPFLFDRPQGSAIVKVFGSRAGAELERLRSEEVLRTREEWFRALYDDNPSMYFTLSPDGTIISVNRYGATQLGYRSDELIGQSVLMVFDAVDRQTVLAQLEQCTGSPFRTFEWDIQKIRKDGTRLWVHERARAIIDSDGTPRILIVCEDVSERRRTRQLLSTLIRESPLPIISLDNKARLTSWNPAATRLFGWSEEEVLGRELPYVRPGDEAASDELWAAGLRGEVAGPIEVRRQRKDGTMLDLLLWPVYLQEEPGSVGTGIAIYVDQSSLIQTEKALRASEERFRQIAETVEEVFWSCDPTVGKILYVSPGYERIWGRPPDSLYAEPKSFLDAIHPDDRAAVSAGLATLQDGLPFGHEYRVVRPDGEIRWVWDRGFPVRDPKTGSLTHYVGVALDITDRKRSEEALRASERRLHRFVADAPVGLMILDQQKRIISANGTFCKMTGYLESELLGHTYALYTHPDDLQANLTLTDSLLQSGCTDYSLEKRYIRKSGEVIWVSVTVTQIELPSHSDPLILAAVQDITARKRSETLLAGEMRYLELIAKETPLPAALEALCTMIEQQNPELLCSILLLDPHSRRLHPCAAPSLPPAYLRSINGVAIGPAVGSCGTAAFHAKPVIVSDIAQDPLWTDCRSLALDHGFRACWSMPILSSSKEVLGTFAIYCRQVLLPSSSDLSLMERATHLAGIAIVKAQVAGEREQWSRDLHDNILQSLYAVGMQLEAAKLAGEKFPRKSKTYLTQAVNQLNHLVLDIRRYITALTQQSTVTFDFGLALRQLAASMSSAKQAAPELQVEDTVLSKITPFLGQQLLSIAREALSNSMRHSQATRRWIRLSHITDAIRLEVGDDGIGFTANPRPRRGHGLANMAARAKTLRAQFSLDSAPGKGTCVTIEAPIEKGSIQ